MAKIIYFAAEGNGKSGHHPIGIDENLTNEEYDIWSECDNQAWICNVYKKSRSALNTAPRHCVY